MRKLLTLAIPMLLGVGLLTAAVHSDPQQKEQSKRLQAGVADTRSQPAVVGEAAAAPTTTTTAPAIVTPATVPPVTPTTTRAIGQFCLHAGGGANTLMADGSSRLLSRTIDGRVYMALATIAGGEGLPQLD